MTGVEALQALLDDKCIHVPGQPVYYEMKDGYVKFALKDEGKVWEPATWPTQQSALTATHWELYDPRPPLTDWHAAMTAVAAGHHVTTARLRQRGYFLRFSWSNPRRILICQPPQIELYGYVPVLDDFTADWAYA